MDDPLERFEQADAVFAQALERSPDERPAFLDRACAGDAGLRRAVELLLQACDVADESLPPGGALHAVEWDEGAADFGNELASGSRLGPYEIVSLLGQGGMGQVFRARDTRLRRDVALKVLDERIGGAHAERFGREARAASALNHPNIVTIYDIGSTATVSYIAMEYIDGQTLHDRLGGGPLELDSTLAWAGQIAAGLAAAHAKGIVHRDLKPANIMIAGDGTAKLVDFGLAKMATRPPGAAAGPTRTGPLTVEGAIFGTVGYMSPEQARGQPLDHRSDLFSFGAVLYEMLTGQRAFGRDSTADVLAAILREQPEPIAQLVPTAPAPLVWAVERCLQKDPAERYDSTRDLARDLRAVAEHRSRGARAGTRCASCGAGNPGDHRYCSRCGAELTQACAACGNEIAVDAVFCGSCGQSLVSSRARPAPASVEGPVAGGTRRRDRPLTEASGMAGERRQATVLVTRLVDYASLIETALPEDVERVVQRLDSTARRVVDEFGGVIDRSSPEEVVALFGIPAAHEDDAVRAARAALELHRVLGAEGDAAPRAELCSALHTGPVVVLQDQRSGGRRVVGEAAQVAAALAQAARPGHVLLSPESKRLVGATLRTEPLAAMRLPNRGGPVVPLRVLGPEDDSLPPLEVSEVPLTAFAGRQDELASLLGCVESAIAGQGQFVAVVGEAGAGKSRLLYELRKQLDHRRVVLVEGRCRSHGEQVPYLPLIQACRAILDVRDQDPAEVQFRNAVGRVRTIDAQLEPLLPLYLQLLSMPNSEHPLPEHLEGKPFRHAMQEALAALFTLASRRQPLALILEDWHWVDEASHDVVRQLVEMCSGYSMVVAVSYRSETPPEWGSPAHQRTVHLTALAPAASAAIVCTVLGARRAPDTLTALIHERTGGNPFFLEEVCRTLLEEGAVRVEDGEVRIVGGTKGLQLPESVQAVIRARLDRIDPAARDLLRRASVIGREFSLGVLRDVADDVEELDRWLAELKERGLVRQDRVVPEPVYRFQHVLTQEVAYDSLLRRQRQELHGRVGRALQRIHGEKSEELCDVLARHFAEAADWKKAVHYGQLAATRARRLSQFPDALTALRRTCEWLERLPRDDEAKELWISVLQEQARVCDIVGDHEQQKQALDDLLDLLEREPDRPELVRAHLRRAELLALARDFAGAERAEERALELSRRLGDVELERDTLRSLAFVLWQQQRNEESLDVLDRALAIDRQRGEPSSIIGDLTNRASVLRHLGRYDEALDSVQEAIRLSEDGRHPHRRVEALYVAYTIHRDLGQTDKGEPYLRQAVAVESEDRFTIHQPFQHIALANMLLERGEIEDAIELLRQSVDKSRQSRYAFGLSRCQQNLAEILLGLGRADEALPHLLEAAESFAGLRDRDSELEMLAAAAPILERRQEHESARRCWTRVADNTDDDRQRLSALRGLARLSDVEGESDLALQYLTRALPLCQRDDVGRAELLNEIGIQQWKAERFEEAAASYREALDIFEREDDTVHAGLVLNSLGATLKSMQRHEDAVATLERALALHERSGQHLLRGHALALLGDVALDRGDAPAAMQRYQESLAVRRQIDDRRGEGWMRCQLARACQAASQTDAARRHAALAVAIAAETGDAELADACAALGLR